MGVYEKGGDAETYSSRQEAVRAEDSEQAGPGPEKAPQTMQVGRQSP